MSRIMPMIDLFQDVNSLPAKNVYPTAAGGTLAGAAAPLNATSNVPVVDPSTGATGTAVTAPTSSPKSAAYWAGFLALLVVMVIVARKAGGEEDFRNIRPTAYNFLTIVLTSIVGIVGLKVVFTKFNIPGASDIILAA